MPKPEAQASAKTVKEDKDGPASEVMGEYPDTTKSCTFWGTALGKVQKLKETFSAIKRFYCAAGMVCKHWLFLEIKMYQIHTV